MFEVRRSMLDVQCASDVKRSARVLALGILGAALGCQQGEAPTFVGAATCAACHQREAELWKGSDHALAMQTADSTTVRGNFNNATFTKDGVTSTFFKRDGQFFVRTDGPDGKLHEYHIAYTFGIEPLQQAWTAVRNGGYVRTCSIGHPMGANVSFPGGQWANANAGKTHVPGNYAGVQALRDLPRFVRLIESGLFDAKSMVGQVFRPDKMKDAVQVAADRSAITSVIDFT